MKYINYFLSIILSFIIITIIILIGISFISTKIELFVVNKNNITANENLIISQSLKNTIVYLKFNLNDIKIIDNIIFLSNYSTNKQYDAISINRLKDPLFKHPIINTKDYIKGNGSLQLNNLNAINQSIPINIINDKFSVAFFIKLSNIIGNKVIVSQSLDNPTMGWIIRVDGKNLKVIIGTNENNNWKEIIIVPNFIDEKNIDWSHVTLTYNINSNPKWNIYIDGIKYSNNLNTLNNLNMNLINVNTKRYIITSCQSEQNCNQISNISADLNLQSLRIGYVYDKPLFTLADDNILANTIANNQNFYKLILSGVRNKDYIIKTIQNTNTFTISFISTISQTINIPVNCTVDILVVAGGGGGGARHGGGGGAGGLIYAENVSLLSGIYTITVGNGGAGGKGRSRGGNGQNSSILYNNNSLIINNINYTAIGGGPGGSWDIGRGSNGGSGGGGGGGGGIGTNKQGNHGGTVSGANTYKHGGGGGAGGIGISGEFRKAGNGGIGKQINITGVSTWYAGGGGGGSHNSDNRGYPTTSDMRGQGGLGGGGAGGIPTIISNGVNGEPNTGGGGGGASVPWGDGSSGGSGGSGIIILKFRISDFKIANQPLYIPAEESLLKFTNHLPEGTLLDDFRLYDFALTENEIKTLYYGNNIASITSSGNKDQESTDCTNNSTLQSRNLISIPGNNAKLIYVSEITLNSTIEVNTQFKQTFKFSDDPNGEYILLFPQPLFHENYTKNPYSPIKIFNKSINELFPNDDINFCAFLSINPLDKLLPNNETFIYNYDVDGKYALKLKVPNCGNITFNESIRPSGDYIYIKTPKSFIISRYSIKAVSGFINRAPKSWTLYIYNPISKSTISYSFPPTGQIINESNYCSINQRTLIVDLNYTDSSQKISSNEYLFVFHSTIGNSTTEKYGMLSIEELNLFVENTSTII